MPTAGPKQTKWDYDAAWHLFLAGATLEEVSEMCQIPHGTLIQYSGRHFWSGRRATALVNAQKAIKEDLARRLEKARVEHQTFMLNQLETTKDHIEGMRLKRDADDETGVELMDKLTVLDFQDKIARRTLRLDEEQKRDPVELGFAMLVAMGRATGYGNLVNESENNNVVDVESTALPKIKMLENTSSAISPLPEDSNAFTGILGPFNGHTNEVACEAKDDILPISSPTNEYQPPATKPSDQKTQDQTEVQAMPESI